MSKREIAFEIKAQLKFDIQDNPKTSINDLLTNRFNKILAGVLQGGKNLEPQDHDTILIAKKLLKLVDVDNIILNHT